MIITSAGKPGPGDSRGEDSSLTALRSCINTYYPRGSHLKTLTNLTFQKMPLSPHECAIKCS